MASTVLCVPGQIYVYERYRNKNQQCFRGPGGEPTKAKCNYIRANVITFAQM